MGCDGSMTDALPVEIELPLPRQIQILLRRRRERHCQRAAVWRASFPRLPLASAPPSDACAPATPSPPVSTGFFSRGAASDAPAVFKPFRVADSVTPLPDVAVSQRKVQKKCTADFDAYFAEWQRTHPEWVRHQDAIAEMQMNGKPVPAVSQPLSPSKSVVPALATSDRPYGCKSVVCKGLSAVVFEDELWELFSSCMTLCRVTLVIDPATGVSKGVAYVDFSDEADVGEALKLDGMELRGRPLRIECFHQKRRR